jgi:hypothetical protein
MADFFSKIWTLQRYLLASGFLGIFWGLAGNVFMRLILKFGQRFGELDIFAILSTLGMMFGLIWTAWARFSWPLAESQPSSMMSIGPLTHLTFSATWRGVVVGWCGMIFAGFVSPLLAPFLPGLIHRSDLDSIPLIFLLGTFLGPVLSVFSMIPAGIIMAPLTQTLWDAIALENTARQDLPS